MKTRNKTSKRNNVPKALPTSTRKAGMSIDDNPKKPFYIAGIGGSAGSLEALEEFFRNMPADSGMAFVLVSHLDPTHKALLAELLQRVTDMLVIQVTDGMKVLPNSVYVIPPNRDMSIMHGTLQLLEPSMPRGFRMPIDFFFRHLADDQREFAIGIILSGMGTDGTLGLKAIKEKMGLVMVQDVSSAKYDGMPQSAINTGLVDFVAPVNELPAKLQSYTNLSPDKIREQPVLEKKASSAMIKIFALLRAQTGNDFSLYKKSTVNRRVERRINVHQIGNINQYLRYISENPHEIDLLFKEILIGVTSFFREPASFEALKDKIKSRFLMSKKETDTIRVWVVGCSTGEEAYSIAMVFRECLDELRMGGKFKIQIYATDIDKDAIDIARMGTYSTNIAQDVSEERLRQFFIKEEGGFRIKSEIREMIVFAQQNVLTDPPFTRLDLLSCRNLLIYLSSGTQKKLMPLFHYSLNPGGLLLLGSSESIGGFMDLFSPRDNKWKLFERREDHVARRSLVEFPTSAHSHLAQMHEAETEHRGSNASIIEMAQTNILQTIAPPVVLINDQGDILYITRQTGKYLEPPVGKANMNIYAMAREGVREVLGVAIREAKTEKRKVTIEGLKVMANGSSQNINLVITPFDKPEAMRGLMMVLFEDVAKPSIEAGDTNCKSRSTSRLKVINEELEKELQHTKEHLQTIIEEMETSQEELKSANEELQSTNEELQSTNEEMVTSKEELQSLNEELITLNAELQSKNGALSETSDDLKNLLDSTQIATLFLDNNLKIKRFTPYVTKIISLIQSDMGRPITDIVSNLQYDDLVTDVNEVLETLVSKETQVQTRDGGSYRLHIVPYRTVDNAIDGVVITFTDVTDFRKMAEGMTLRTLYAEAIIRTVREPLVVLDSEMKIVSANPSFYRMFHVASEETEGQTLYSLGNGQWNIPVMRQLLEKILPQDTEIEGFLTEHEFPIIGKRRMLLNARRIAQEGSSKELILLAIEDITDQKEQSQISIGGGRDEERTI